MGKTNPTSHFVQMPNDGAGKRIKSKIYIQFEYKDKIADINQGDHLGFPNVGTHGIHGYVADIRTKDSTTGTIVLQLHNDLHPIDQSTLLTVDEVFYSTQNDGNDVATVATSGIIIYHNTSLIASGSNPDNSLEIDGFGAGYVRFSEGSQQFDATGRTRVVNTSKLWEMNLHHETHTTFLGETDMLGGTASWDHDSSAVHMTVPATTNAMMMLESHRHIKYTVGTSHTVLMGVSLGDAGKAGVVRRWGLYNTNNGIRFEKNETDELNLILTSNASGTPLETVVAQSDWNLDTGDGLSNHGFNIDVSKVNTFYISIVWGAGGHIICGAYYNGTRVPLHRFDGDNVSAYSIMHHATLPLHFHQQVLDGGAAVTSSEMRVYSAIIESDGEPLIEGRHREKSSNAKTLSNAAADNAWIPIISFKPRVLDHKGEPNYTVMIPESLSFSSVSSTDFTTPVRVKVEMFKNPAGESHITSQAGGVDPSWGIRADADFEFDTTATKMDTTGLEAIYEAIVSGTETNIDLRPFFNYVFECLYKLADDTQPVYTLGAKVIDTAENGTTHSPSVIAGMVWQEVSH